MILFSNVTVNSQMSKIQDRDNNLRLYYERAYQRLKAICLKDYSLITGNYQN